MHMYMSIQYWSKCDRGMTLQSECTLETHPSAGIGTFHYFRTWKQDQKAVKKFVPRGGKEPYAVVRLL